MQFYVYEHWRPDTNQCFYVGKGNTNSNRGLSFKRRNRYYSRVVAKLNRNGLKPEVRIVEQSPYENDIFRLEEYWIAVWRKRGAPLTNSCDGGEGVTGHKHTKETRKKLSENHKGKKQSVELIEKRIAPLRGKKLRKRTPKEIEAMRKRATGKKYGPCSEDTKKKISAKLKGKKRGPMPDYHREAISKGNKGKKLSKKHRLAISKAKTGVLQGPHTKEHNAKIGDARRGKKDPPKVCAKKKKAALLRGGPTKEVIEKISKSVAALWESPAYRRRMQKAHAERKPASKLTRKKMRKAQRARRAKTKVSAKTRARASASIKEWHAKQGHKISP